jgi:hypothetical protein
MQVHMASQPRIPTSVRLMMLDRMKCIQHLSLVLLRLRLPLKRYNHYVLIQFCRYWSKKEVKQYILIPKWLLILIGIIKNCQSSRRNLSFHLFIRRVIKLTVVIIKEYHFYQLHIKFIWHSSFEVNLMSSWNYLGSSLLDTGEEMGVQWDSTSDVYGLQESLWFS